MPKGVYVRKKGWKPWNFGLTKHTDNRVAMSGKKGSKSLKGKKPWCTGLTKETDVRLKNAGLKIGQKLKGRHNSSETEYGGVRGPVFTGHNWGLCRKCGKDHGPNPATGRKRPDVSLRNKTPEMREASRLRSLGNTYGKANKGRKITWGNKISLAKIGKPSPKRKRDGYFGNHNWISRREPNYSEEKINNWIKETDLPFVYTGNKVDEKLGISPDWTHISKPYYIEFDCSFWHKDKEKDAERNDIYKDNDCKLLILEDEDLLDRDSTINKIMGFENS